MDVLSELLARVARMQATLDRLAALDGGVDGAGSGTANRVAVWSSTKKISAATALIWDGTSFIVGDVTNGAELNATDGLLLRGTATVWDDLRVEPVARSTGAKAPTFGAVGLGGLYVYQFDNAAAGSEKEVYCNIQMSHAWAKTGIYIHVHWMPLTADASKVVRWGLEYSWASPGQTFGAAATIYATTIVTGATGTQYSHIITAFSVLTPSVSQNALSSVLVCRLFRDSANAADTYGYTAGLLYVDAHVEVNKLGSATEY